MSKVVKIRWKCEYCGKEFEMLEENAEEFMTVHRELHELCIECGLQIVWDEEKKKYRAFSMLTGKEVLLEKAEEPRYYLI